MRLQCHDLVNTIKRFSLRLPKDLFKAIQHATIEIEKSVNDYVLSTIEVTPSDASFAKSYLVNKKLDKRYPLRLPVAALENVTSKAQARECSINLWLVRALHRRVAKEGWLKNGSIQKKAS